MHHPQVENIAQVFQEQVTLKTLTSDDIDSYMNWATDDEVTKYKIGNNFQCRRDIALFFKNVVEKHPWFKSICLEKDVIGCITLNKGYGAHSCKAELGYVIARKYWGHGYATQAVKLAVASGFKDLNVERIEAYVDPDNIASQRVLEKSGFTKEGLLKHCVLQKGVAKDRLIYSKLKAPL